MTRKAAILTLAALLAAGTATLTPKPALAGADGRRNTTIALGAAAVYELLQHKTTNALILGAGTAYAEKQYENARSNERNQNNNRRYYRPGGYDNNGGYYNGNGDYEQRTDGGHDGNNRDNGSHNGRNQQGSDNCDSRDNRGRDGQPYKDNRYNSDRQNGSRRPDPRGPHRAWDGRALPSGQNNGQNSDRH